MVFHGKWQPEEREAVAGEAFPTALAVGSNGPPSAQNHALNAIVFVYRRVLKKALGWLAGEERAKKPARLPVVFVRDGGRVVPARRDEGRWVTASRL